MKTVIIGAGGIAQPHAKALERLGVQIAGVLDVSKDKALAFSGRYGCPVIGDLDDIIGKVDMIHLLTPPSERVGYVRTAAAAGKHIFIEKPIAINISDAEEIISLAGAGRVKLMVNFNHRFRDGFLMLKEAFDSGALGEAVSLYAQRFGAGHGFLNAFEPSWRTRKDLMCGMSIESLSHEIDMLLQIAGGIDSVSAVVSETIAELPGFDNNVSASFRTSTGAVGSIHASWTSHLGHSERGVIGTKGSAVISGNDLFSFEEFTIRTEGMPYPRVTKVGELFSLVDDHSFDRTNKHFMECVINDAAPASSGEDGLRALKVSLAILESSRLGKVVKVV